MLDHHLLHFVSLGGPGGVERHLSAFVNRALARGDGWQHSVLAAGGRVHPRIAASLDGSLVVGREKYAGRFKLPAKPRALRRAALRGAFARARPDAVLIWNRPVRSRSLFDAVTPACWLAWEHGAAWHSQAEARQNAYYARCPRIIANSEATRRVLALRWGREERVDVCLNALRPELLPAPVAPRQPPARRLRLGIAGRSASVKGAPIALHALALLHARGIEAELHVAGDGPCRAALDALARRLAVSASMVWHGFVEDMGPFYTGIDCLVHPALHESFGLVCLEAAAHGCPVVAAAVDGLPEIVQHEATGFCVAPELPVSAPPSRPVIVEEHYFVSPPSYWHPGWHGHHHHHHHRYRHARHRRSGVSWGVSFSN